MTLVTPSADRRRPSMPVVVVATFTVKPESVDTVREVLKRGVNDVHDEPGCQLYALHESGNTFVFVEQWPTPTRCRPTAPRPRSRRC
ncbi:antibiotic biosynthesis monooxygenase family protein [Mycobacterium xenopi 4042]|uniref:Antibiotic biosynthesis monooxygenase family protein n=1 Tax=Mycobacterium xenopi 4042 TaxID=1299334 RepID=X8CGJ7_MYCXE|nr:antibiotic biosynthesis monooxygenase family protein [Mycobacterium xenopi 4042]